MATGVNALTGSQSSAGDAAPAASGGLDQLAQKETFLKLLVTQIRNQNPLNPADGVEFLSQLTQFSELEQMIEMRSELQAIREALTVAASTATDGSAPAEGKES